MSSSLILAGPEPVVQVTSLDADAVELSFRVAEMAVAGTAGSEIFDLIYRHTK